MMFDLGIRLLHVPQTEHERDIEEFDGPILSQCRSESGAVCIEKWCERGDGYDRTLVVRSDFRSIAEYMAGRIGLRTLLTRPSDGVGTLRDSGRGLPDRAWLVSLDSLPASYIPASEVRHDSSLRPDWASSPQSFIFDSGWDAAQIAKMEKLYLEAYAIALFSSSQYSDGFPSSILGYKYDSGFTYAQAFRQLRQSVPLQHAARTVSVQAASPGILSIEAPAITAARLTEAIARVARRDVQRAYRLLHSWSRMRTTDFLDVPRSGRDDVVRLSGHLGMSTTSLRPLIGEAEEFIAAQQGEPDDPISAEFAKAKKLSILVAGKLVAAYFRRLRDLANPRWDGVEFLSPTTEQSLAPVPEQVAEPEGEDDLFHGVSDDEDDDSDLAF